MPEQSIQTDTATSIAFLREISQGWSALPEPVALELRCLMPERTPDISRFGHDEAGIAALVQHASAMNAAGLNCYIVVNPVRASAPLRRDGKLSGAMDEDIPAAFYFWADGDDEQAAHSIRNFAGPKYTMAVMTGTVPSPRPHVYWRCADGPMYDLALWTVIQRGIARVLSTDRTVVNPSRIMRLPGTINIPTKAKALKGRVPELTTFRSEYPDARPPVTLEQMQRVFGAETAQPAAGGLHIDTGSAGDRRTADEYADILRRARTDGEKHGGVRDLAASLAGSGVPRHLAEAIIREACPIWDAGVERLIDTAYEKFFKPEQQAFKQNFDDANAPEWPTVYDMFDEAALAPRQWVYGKHYLRRFVSVLASAGGIGKTSMQIVEALAICTGRPLLGEKVEEQCNVWLINLEDPMDEMQRRILAAMRHYGIRPDEVRGKLFVDAGRDFSLNFAVQTREGITANTALVEHLTKRIPERKIGAVFIDPFVGAHQINENDNMAVNAVVAQIRQVADETNCAIGLVHHIRKGNGEDATIDSVRGAGSLIGAARAARVINKVSEQDALSLGVDPKEAQGLFRVDDGKANLAPPASAAVFRRMEGVQIGNGEWVGVATPFALPDEWEGMGTDTTNEILRLIDAGFNDDDGSQNYYSIRPQDTERFVGNVITEYKFANPEHKKNLAQSKRIITQWHKSGLLEVFEFKHERTRKEPKGVRSTGRVGEQR